MFPQQKGNTRKTKAGLRYERKVHERLYETFELDYVASQWFTFHDGESVRHCQPDGILLFPESKILLICEVKYSHTPEAFWQLEHLYVPVLRAFIGASPWRIATCEIVKWYDPTTRFPVRHVLRENLSDVKVGEFAVHILNR